jgi:Caspase domain
MSRFSITKSNVFILLLFFFGMGYTTGGMGYTTGGPIVKSLGKFTKHALLIGISNYEKDWASILAKPDVDSIEAALIFRGFKKENIVKLLDSNATKKGILKAIEKMSDELQYGDVFHLHFSGHGQQVVDVNGDEIDGLDEALVCYDGPAIFREGYQFEGHLLDDELGELIGKLETKIGVEGQIAVSIDAPHSGPESFQNDSSTGFVQSRGGLVEEITNSERITPVILLSASLANELAFEYEGMGAWAYAFVKALKSPEVNTFRQLQSHIETTFSKLKFNHHSAISGEIDRRLYSEPRASSYNSASGHDKTVNFYVLSIGISDYDIPSIRTAGFSNCVKDARLFDGAISRQFHRFHKGDSNNIFSHVLLNDEASLEGILGAINDIINQSKKEDYFFFNFSGFSVEYTDADSAKDLYFVPFSEGQILTNFEIYDSLNQTDSFISLRRLKDLLVFIPCQNQLIVSEAGTSSDFTRLFTKAMIETSPSIMEIEKRNRVIMVPQEIGLNNFTCGDLNIQNGPIAYFLSELSPMNHILDLFNPKKSVRSQMAYEFLKAEAACDFRKPYMEISFEREIIENLQFLTEGISMQSRGGRSKSTSSEKAQSTFAKKYALLIGSNDYEKGRPMWQDLKNPIVDAKAIADLLKTVYGYEVIVLEDPDANQVIKALEGLSKKLNENDQFLCFIAGHGDYDPDFFDDGFMVLSESVTLTNDPYRRSYLPFSQVGNIIDNLPCKQVLLMVDVCFGGAFDQKLSNGPLRNKMDGYGDMSVDKMIKSKSEKQTRIIMSSGSLNVVPDGYNGKHSPFAARIIAGLESNGGERGVLTSNQLYEMVSWLPSKPFKGELKGNEPGSEFFLIPAKN